MLMGIVKPNREIQKLEGIGDTLRAAAVRCFEAGYLYGVNEQGAMITLQTGAEVPVMLPDPRMESEQPEHKDPTPQELSDASDRQTADADSELRDVSEFQRPKKSTASQKDTGSGVV